MAISKACSTPEGLHVGSGGIVRMWPGGHCAKPYPWDLLEKEPGKLENLSGLDPQNNGELTKQNSPVRIYSSKQTAYKVGNKNGTD